MVLITMDGTGLVRCDECKEDLKNLQKHLMDKHGFPDAAIEGIGTVSDHNDKLYKTKPGQQTL